MPKVKGFVQDRSGAITVDWIVLCAALVAFVVFSSNLVGQTIVDTATASTASTAGIGQRPNAGN